MGVLDIISEYWPALLNGLKVTLFISICACVFGLLSGFSLGVLAYRSSVARISLHILGFVSLSIPFLVWLYWFHFPLQQIFQIVVPPTWTTIFLLSFLNCIAVAEIWNSSLKNTDKEGYLVARMYGLKPVDAVRYIQVPIAVRQALPMLLALQVAILQLTLFSSLISVEEIFRVSQRINSAIYRPIEIYSALAIFFLVVCGPIYLFAFLLQKRFSRQLER